MSIAVLFSTVVTRKKAIEERYPGGLKEYSKQPYVWFDQNVIGSSFMNALDLEQHLQHLKNYGIALDDDNCSEDVAVVSQASGILTNANWLQYGEQNGYWTCWLTGEQLEGEIAFPKEW